MSNWSQGSALNVTIGCSLVSLLLSLYMTLTHYVAGELPSWCTFGSVFSCADLLRSDWALLFGTPIALLGLAWNAVLLGLATQARDELHARPRLDVSVRALMAALRLWLVSGVLFVVYLVAVELYLGKICPLCTAVHVATLLATYAVWPHSSWAAVTDVPVATLALAALVMLAPLVGTAIQNARSTGGGGAGRAPVAAAPVSLVACLEEKKVEIIGHERCAVCRLQTTFFDGAPRLLRIVEMSAADEATFLEPLWLEDGKRVHQGLLTVSELKLKFQC